MKWLNTSYEDSFSFGNVVCYLFGEDVDCELIRDKLKQILLNRDLKGSKNLLKIFKEYA